MTDDPVPHPAETEIERLLDEAAIHRVLHGYALAVDRRDWPALRRCFHADARLDYDGFVQGNLDAFVAFLESDRGVAGLDATMHLIGASVITFDGDVALAETTGVAEHLGPAGHPWCDGQVTAWCRYLDRFALDEGTWRICHRRATVVWSRRQDRRGTRTGEPRPARGAPPA